MVTVKGGGQYKNSRGIKALDKEIIDFKAGDYANILSESANLIYEVNLTLSTGGATTQTISGKVSSIHGAAIEAPVKLLCYLCTDEAGATPSAEGAHTSVTATTGKVLVAHTAKLVLEVLTDADGEFVLSFDNNSGSGAYTDRLAVVIPHSGQVIVSDALNVAHE